MSFSHRLMAMLLLLAVLTWACSPSDSTRNQPLEDLSDLSIQSDSSVEQPADLSQSSDLEEEQGTLVKIATFNVQRFFDLTCDSGYCEPGDYEELPTSGEFYTKASRISEGIKTIQPDIIILEEVESQDNLDVLASYLSSTWPDMVIGETGKPASLDVVIISKWPHLSVLHHDDPIPYPNGGTTTFARDFLEVRYLVDNQLIIVFGAHFISKHSDDPDRRLAEAMAAHEMVINTAQQFPEALIVMGGDLNDVPGSAPIQALEKDGQLLRVASDIGDQAATYRYDNTLIAIDHLFLATQAFGHYVPQSAQVFWGGNTPGVGFASSDHAALRATFEYP